ncbi:uncharacterized protein BDV17DRAFT_296488 [Aspergillus undulatus]|uniref:uncharacterized protein n=1 Tax=Aspergillus undulatus TaxID=1810928 RepID=UPI003CCDA605
MRSASAIVVGLLSLTALASAAPGEKRQIDSVSLTFYGTENDSWGQTFPTDLNSVEIDKPAVVTHIYNPGGAICVISGTEGGSWTIHIGDHQLDKPQPLKSGFCGDL